MAETRRKEKDPARITLSNVRLSHPHVFTAKSFGRPRAGEQNKPAFSATALVKISRATLVDKIWDAVDAAKEKAFPGKKPADVKIKKSNMALFEGDNPGEDVEKKEEWKGMLVVRARSYKKPLVLDQDGEEVRESDNVIYGGCYVDMIVQFWAQDYEGTKRLNCSIEGIRFREDGEPFGAGPIDPSEFDEGVDDEEKGGGRRGRDEDDDRGSRRGRDEDDDRGSRRGRGRDEEDEPRGGSRRRGEDDDEPRRGRRDEEDEPRGSSRRRGEDDDEPKRGRRDEEDEPRGRGRRDEDDEPRGRGRSRDEDDEPRGSSRRRDEEDEPRGSSRRRGEDDEPRGSSRRRGEDDDEPRGRGRSRDDDDDRGSRRRGGREDLS